MQDLFMEKKINPITIVKIVPFVILSPLSHFAGFVRDAPKTERRNKIYLKMLDLV